MDITKVSAAAYGHISGMYALLRSGGAAGWGCGPLLVSGERLSDRKRLAIPGLMTTAYMLAGMYDSKLRDNIVVMPFDKIMPAVRDGEADLGLIIHEGRFTYQDYGLTLVADLGAWWQMETGLPVPLGAIAAKREIQTETRAQIDDAIRASVSYAYANIDETMTYVRHYAQELSDEVIMSHIRLYVNEFSMDCGALGAAAIETFMEMARQRGIYKGKP